ncbi:MAG: hypothetical protein KBT11_07245 [Treponema sp.]|nr:hypothetical protein [Candidatus Treponema equifaecale]
MDFSLENFLKNVVVSFPEVFTAKDVLYLLRSLGHDITLEEITYFLDTDPRVFSLQHKKYITRAGAFTNQIFSIQLTQKEIEQQVFIPGDRCMPFVDGERYSFALNFEYKGKRLKPATLELDKSSALDLFTLYGEEYSAQYVASDPASEKFHIAENDFELPPRVVLSGYSLKEIFKDVDFKLGDRLVASVKNWAEGTVTVFPLVENRETPFSITEMDFERQKWNEMLETALLESFEKMGPCSCIEEQLANVFYENCSKLCIIKCGSIHEFLASSKKIGIEYFGVETRLWRKGEEIPAVGGWNMNTYGAGTEGNISYFAMPDFLIDSFIKDFHYAKKNEIHELMETIVPKTVVLTPPERDELLQEIKNRNERIAAKYNWFADHAFGAIRHKALELYSKVETFVSDFDCSDKEFKDLPQQELVTLSQLFTHISRILEITSNENDCGDDEIYAMQLSLEGMEANFEEIRPLIASALDKLRKNRFNVI